MSIDSLKYNLEEYLGKNIRSDEVQDLLDYICDENLRKYYFEGSDDSSGNIHYINNSKGLLIQIEEEDQVVSLISIYSENLFFCDVYSRFKTEFRDDDVLRQFKGTLPLNIKFTDSIEEIINKNGNGKKDDNFLNYNQEKVSYSIVFDENDEFIERIDLCDNKYHSY
jgi:hypothetical protein